jgi:hypothetical protein
MKQLHKERSWQEDGDRETSTYDFVAIFQALLFLMISSAITMSDLTLS